MSTALRGLLAGLLAAVLLLAAGPARAQVDGVLRVGVAIDNKPWLFRDSKGNLVGYEADMIAYVGERLDMRVHMVDMPFSRLFPALRSRAIDIALASISITQERLARFDFTQPYYDSSQGVVVLRRSSIRSLPDLEGKMVGATPGTTSQLWLTDNGERYHIAGQAPVEGLAEAVERMTQGEIEAYVGDLPALLYELLRRSDLAVVARLPNNESYAMMLAKRSALTARVDGAITQMKRDGTLARIHQKWFGMQPAADSSTVQVRRRP